MTTVRSTGVAVIAGCSPPPAWVDIALQFGVDLSDHRAVAPGMWLDEADLVLAMTADHLREIVVVHPFLLGRATTLAGAAHSAAARSGSRPAAHRQRGAHNPAPGRHRRPRRAFGAVEREVARRFAHLLRTSRGRGRSPLTPFPRPQRIDLVAAAVVTAALVAGLAVRTESR